jgi:hypothetical protein
LLDQRTIPGHVIESFHGRIERDLIFHGELFGGIGIRTMDRLVDNRRPDPSTLEE